MPRQRSAGRPSAPSRPTVSAAKPAPTQTRPATTMAAPPQQHAAPPAAAPAAPAAAAPSQGPGLFGQMASTAATCKKEPEANSIVPPNSGVAIGSSIGHAIGGMFGGGSSAPAEAAPQNNSPVASGESSTTQQWGNNCAGATQQFTKCMDEQGGNMQICNWYLEQLKACQAAASQY
ncbi:CHCH domain-containing protein [Colletotrichum fioriniae PJ7]|uniref:CHCH domain-containing protein n=1 Tax=Colletotrichum fioriniae PJ7 TaxID=1445577 RepID=A0A010REX0_9PEZI|nr:CHCH domain-containing protein [Colletotrichum fioriniae PJ7]